MPWTEIARRDYARNNARYSSDLTDREWAVIEPLLPAVKRIGRSRTTDLREGMNAILYLASGGCAWSLFAVGFPAALDRAALFPCLSRYRPASSDQCRPRHRCP
ncbi:transposase [Jiella sp. KSK16Y-1]|uniref:Transposase n=1 Tax=Jiella mangrovi TaxID=2821407 RepID=A0ABS4BNP8_9HYPH|nr:transposase [Jiella mangrovi]